MGAMPVPVEIKIESVTGCFKNEVAVRPVDLNGAPRGQIGEVGEVIGKESAFYPVDAQVEAILACGRGDGIGAGLLLPSAVGGDGGNELPGYVRKAFQLIDDEIEVVALGDFRDAFLAIETRRIKLTFQAKPRGKMK